MTATPRPLPALLLAVALGAAARAAPAAAPVPCYPGFSPPCPETAPAPLATATQYASHLRCHYAHLDLAVEIRAARPFDLTDPDREAQCRRILETLEMEAVP